VGGKGNTDNGDEAFIWDATNGMRNLKSVLSSSGVDMTGWILRVATGISSNGNVVVGWGTNPSGNTEAWMAHLQ
jgi:hypothetical protein